MAFTDTTNRQAYTCNGVTVDFAFAHPFNVTADLVVLKVLISDGTETTLTITTDYTIAGTADAYGAYPDGATITTVATISSLYRLIIYRAPARTQGVTHVENDPLPVISGVENPLNKLTMIAQRIHELITRSLRQPDGDSADITALPAKVTRASKYLTFDADGDPIAAAAPADTTAVSVFMATVLDDTTAAAARTTLDVPSNAEAILDTLIAAKGDVIVGTANDTPAVLTVGANGTVPMAHAGTTEGMRYVAALTKAIHGLTYGNGTDATNDIDFAAGGCMDSTGVIWITCAAMAGKQLDANWAPGAAAGMRNSGVAIDNVDYYLYAVEIGRASCRERV